MDEKEIRNEGRSRRTASLVIRKRMTVVKGSSGASTRRRPDGCTRTSYYDALCQLVPTLDKAFQGPPQQGKGSIEGFTGTKHSFNESKMVF